MLITRRRLIAWGLGSVLGVGTTAVVEKETRFLRGFMSGLNKALIPMPSQLLDYHPFQILGRHTKLWESTANTRKALLVFLHGMSDNNGGVFFQRYPAFIDLFTQLRANGVGILMPSGRQLPGFDTQSLGWAIPGSILDERDGYRSDLTYLAKVISQIRQNGEKLILGGFSTGAFFYPNLLEEKFISASDVAAGVSISGWRSPGSSLLSEIGIPILAVHGRSDTSVPIQGGYIEMGLGRRNPKARPFNQMGATETIIHDDAHTLRPEDIRPIIEFLQSRIN